MRLSILAIILFTVVACCKNNVNEVAYSSHEEIIYRSNERSFLPDFFLIIKDSTLIFYGWQPAFPGDDTLYYRSKTKLNSYKRYDFGKNDQPFYDSLYKKDYYLSFELKNIELSHTRYDPNNLSDFKPDTSLQDLMNFMLYTHFVQGKQFGDSINILGCKMIYWGRSDEFVFQKIHKSQPE